MRRLALEWLAAFAFVGLCGFNMASRVCYMGQEPDESQGGRLRWVMSGTKRDMCTCTSIRPGSLNTVPIERHGNHHPLYTDTPIFTDDQEEIHDYFGCLGCVDAPLGMENGRIPNASISASSMYPIEPANHAPQRARLNTKDYAGAWCAADEDEFPWIQVDFMAAVRITKLITQGRSDLDQWVTWYQVAYGQDSQVWSDVTGSGEYPANFTGNSDRNTQVTNSFASALQARYLRIKPKDWHGHCSMRFEVIGCRIPDNNTQ